MPFLKDNQFNPSNSGGPSGNAFNVKNTPAKASVDPNKGSEESLFKGGSRVARYNIKRALEKNQKIRKELAKELKLKVYSPEMDAQIKNMEEMLPDRFGGFIDLAEAKRAMYEESWHQKHDLREKAKGGLTTLEIKEMNRRHKAGEFLKKKLGLEGHAKTSEPESLHIENAPEHLSMPNHFQAAPMHSLKEVSEESVSSMNRAAQEKPVVDSEVANFVVGKSVEHITPELPKEFELPKSPESPKKSALPELSKTAELPKIPARSRLQVVRDFFTKERSFFRPPVLRAPILGQEKPKQETVLENFTELSKKPPKLVPVENVVQEKKEPMVADFKKSAIKEVPVIEELKKQPEVKVVKESDALQEPLKNEDAPVVKKPNINTIEEAEEAFPFAVREYDPGKAMPSASEQSFSRPDIVTDKGKDVLSKLRVKPKLSDLKFQEKWKIEEILDKAREQGLVHPPLASGVLTPEEVREYEILELEKMFPRYFGGLEDTTKIDKMIDEMTWHIGHMEKDPKNWEKVTVEENKLKFLQSIRDTKV